VNVRDLRLLKSVSDDINYRSENFTYCEACIQGKHARDSFPIQSQSRTSQRLELIHSDSCEPEAGARSWGGARYLFIFTDDYSRKCFGYFFLKNLRHLIAL